MSAKSLPDPTVYITGHDNTSGKSILYPQRPLKWDPYDDGSMPLATAYINKFPADLNNDADLADYDRKLAAGKVGLVSGGGSLLRYMDLAPAFTTMEHRTQSIDYGVVIEGEIEIVLDSGEVQLLKPGDIMVQRGTEHAWRNPSKTAWARMVFVLEDCLPLKVGGTTLKEDLGRLQSELPASGNDV